MTRHECLHNEDLRDIRNDLTDIKTALNIKGLTNGQIKERVNYIGKRSEEEDNKIKRELRKLREEMNEVKIELASQRAVNKEIILLLRGILGALLVYIGWWIFKTYILGI